MISLGIGLLFWVSLGLLFHTFVGYALWLLALSRIRPRPIRKADPTEWPRVAVLIVARAAEAGLPGRLQNLAGSDYPSGRMECVLVRDGGLDSGIAVPVESALNLRVLDLPAGSGKPACLNAGIAGIDAEIVVFADARQNFAPDAIRELVRNFTDPGVGAVSGALEIRGAETTTGGGVDSYWRVEKLIRSLESRTGSCIGCTGAIYAARRGFLGPIPEDTWLDDVLIPMRIAQAGARVLFDPGARAFDPQPLEPETESTRKPRTLGGNFQLLARHPGWIVPGIGRLWWRYLSHKVLRLAGPLLLAAVFGTGLALAGRGPFHAGLFAGQLTVYFLALAGILAGARGPAFRLPAAFLFLNWMVVRGFAFWWRNRGRRSWSTAAT